ncbi:MAG: phosphate/phosphite/phosphonate ABC transporter substrate-binding protein [Flexistipes sinusarabici]|uniref:Phosphate/phosphite/phosphonate ABC transporter substrate-binding protein n=1 Tax=Flexistipes sinusarabici TaxID=2352 RepID=A0A5D0MND9_FLESI|nr:phosphate/phosphite/phosphonate ABC transporter substrate-binding protein [Flexistipes sinusarabici]TYB35217.1 MAG: phosphate/phosphite/phosphonate ABC transporter substrate-binding protein [Flexistipes sinusarabici]
MKRLFLFLLISLFSLSFNSQAQLKFGIASMISPEETFILYKDLNDYIAEKLDMRIETVLKKDYSDMNKLIVDNKVDFALVCTGSFFFLQDNEYKLMVTPVIDGKSTYRSYIIANSNSGIDELIDLKGKTFAFADRLSNSGSIYPKYIIIKRFNISYENFFQETFYTHSHDKSIYLVNKGVIDGAAVDSLVYDYLAETKPDEVRNIRIIHKSPYFPAPSIVASGAIDKKLFDEITRILLKMHKDPKGKKILGDLNIDKFVVTNPERFEEIRKMQKLVDDF